MKIFVVDDDPVARLIAVDLLRDPQFEVREFEDGASLLAAIDDAPDLILLDIEMPGMDGFTACRVLRQAGNDPLTVFISSHDDLESRLTAYQAGGSDFIVKPYAATEFAEKIQAMQRLIEKRRELQAQAQYAAQTAFTAMSSMGELGAVLQFLKSSYSLENSAQLAKALFDTLQQYGLEGVLEIRMCAERDCFSSRGQFTPLEDSILGHARSMDRIFHFRDRMVINDPALTLIILNLPVDDPERIGRLRDHLAILVDGAAARIRALESEKRRSAQTSGISQVIAEISQTLAEVDRNQAGNRAQAMTVNSDFLQALTRSFTNMGLSEDQEATLTRLAENAYTRLGELMDDNRFISDRLNDVRQRLNQLAAL